MTSGGSLLTRKALILSPSLRSRSLASGKGTMTLLIVMCDAGFSAEALVAARGLSLVAEATVVGVTSAVGSVAGGVGRVVGLRTMALLLRAGVRSPPPRLATAPQMPRPTIATAIIFGSLDLRRPIVPPKTACTA